MNDLASVLTTVRATIAKFSGQAIGEENTKHALIEPVLGALGWDVADLDEVRCEYRYRSGADPVDYALLQLGTPRLFVEAKALGENLEKWATQIMGYAGVAGVGWAVLTDGNEYRIYNAGSNGDLETKLFRRVAVASDTPGVADTLGLLSKSQLQENQIEVIWRAEKVDRAVKGAVEGLVAPEAAADFLHLLRKRLRGLSVADVRASLARARIIIEYPAARPPAPQAKLPRRSVTLRGVIASGAIRPPLEIETTYKGHRLTARIEADGTVLWDGAVFDSLSTAAGMARKSIIGAPPGREYPQTNGWGFWRFRDSDGRLVPVDELRQRHVGP